MDGNYLIPANSKRAQLIFSIFRPIDLGIAITGATLTLILFIAIQPESLWWAIVTLTPLLTCAFLVVPVPNYHNILCVIGNIYRFYIAEPREFTWKGWCAKDEFKD